jgi:hypothetical protein
VLTSIQAAPVNATVVYGEVCGELVSIHSASVWLAFERILVRETSFSFHSNYKRKTMLQSVALRRRLARLALGRAPLNPVRLSAGINVYIPLTEVLRSAAASTERGLGRRDDMFRPPGICYRYGAVHVRDSRIQGPKSGVYGEVDDELCEEEQTASAGTVGLEFRRSVRFPEFSRPGRSFLLVESARLSLGFKGYLFLPSAPITSSYPGGEALVELGQGQAMPSYLAAPGGSGVDPPHRLFDGGMGGNSSGREGACRTARDVRGTRALGRGSPANSPYNFARTQDSPASR